ATSIWSSARSSRRSRTWRGSHAKRMRRSRRALRRLRPSSAAASRPASNRIFQPPFLVFPASHRYKPAHPAIQTPLEANRGNARIFDMATVREMKAMARPRAGKGAARAERRAGRVPGVIYGDDKDPITISVDHAELKQRIYGGRFLTTIYELDVDGTKHRVIPRDFQLD